MNKNTSAGPGARACAALCLLLAMPIASAQFPPVATPVDLGTLGGAGSQAVAVNDAGQVVGISQRNWETVYLHAFSWTASGGMVDLTAGFPTAIDSHVIGVSNDGRVFGNFFDGVDYRAFTWTAAGGAVETGTQNGSDSLIQYVNASGQAVGRSGFAGFFWSAAGGLVDLGPRQANAISDAGHVVGHRLDAFDPGDTRAFVWTAAGGFVDLGNVLPGWPDARGCSALGVNDLGEVVGTCGRFGDRHGFYWSAATGMLDVGARHWPRFINNAGEVAGAVHVDVAGAVVGQAFFWTRAGGHVYPFALPGNNSEPIGLSESGWITGALYYPVNGGYSTYVAQRGSPPQAVRLQPGAWWEFPLAMNAAGHIVGTSIVISGPERGFYWSPDFGVIELPPLEGGNQSGGTALSNSGLAAGNATAAAGYPHATLWTLELDTDGDGIPDRTDPDDDNDGVPDALDAYPLGRFADARPGHWAFLFIETLARTGITGGCGGDNYCPDRAVTRAQMAVFLERGMRGAAFTPPAATGNVFLDVPANAFGASFIEQLYLDGITGGCGGNNYCPSQSVTRAQMAVFLLRARYGRSYLPPAPTGRFADVSTAHWAAGWIERLAAEGITGGCGGGNYCPEAPVTRAQMAVFLVRTFGL